MSETRRVSQDELLGIVAELARTSPEWDRKKYPDWRDRLALDLYDERRISGAARQELAAARTTNGELAGKLLAAEAQVAARDSRIKELEDELATLRQGS